MPIRRAISSVPLDLVIEHLTGLVWSVSARARTPKPPSSTLSIPPHVVVHQRDERLDVAGAEGVVGSPYGIGIHCFQSRPVVRDASYALRASAQFGGRICRCLEAV